jgi:hypothetical protein
MKSTKDVADYCNFIWLHKMMHTATCKFHMADYTELENQNYLNMVAKEAVEPYSRLQMGYNLYY